MSGVGGPGRHWHRPVWLAAGLVGLVCLLWVLSAPVQAREVSVGLYDNDSKIFRDEFVRPTGLFVGMVRAIAAREGWEQMFEDCQSSTCLERTVSGEIDLMPDVAIREQLAFLESNGCDSYQGDFFSPPLPAPAFERLLGEQ